MERGPWAQLVVAANLERRYRTVGMVDDGGRLMTVCSQDQVVRVDTRRMSSLEMRVELFHVDLQEETLSRIEDLGERTVFAGLRGAMLLPSTTPRSPAKTARSSRSSVRDSVSSYKSTWNSSTRVSSELILRASTRIT
jgi:hypothetical protein